MSTITNSCFEWISDSSCIIILSFIECYERINVIIVNKYFNQLITTSDILAKITLKEFFIDTDCPIHNCNDDGSDPHPIFHPFCFNLMSLYKQSSIFQLYSRLISFHWHLHLHSQCNIVVNTKFNAKLSKLKYCHYQSFNIFKGNNLNKYFKPRLLNHFEKKLFRFFFKNNNKEIKQQSVERIILDKTSSLTQLISTLPKYGIIKYEQTDCYWYILLPSEWQNVSELIAKHIHDLYHLSKWYKDAEKTAIRWAKLLNINNNTDININCITPPSIVGLHISLGKWDINDLKRPIQLIENTKIEFVINEIGSIQSNQCVPDNVVGQYTDINNLRYYPTHWIFANISFINFNFETKIEPHISLGCIAVKLNVNDVAQFIKQRKINYVPSPNHINGDDILLNDYKTFLNKFNDLFYFNLWKDIIFDHHNNWLIVGGSILRSIHKYNCQNKEINKIQDVDIFSVGKIKYTEFTNNIDRIQKKIYKLGYDVYYEWNDRKVINLYINFANYQTKIRNYYAIQMLHEYEIDIIQKEGFWTNLQFIYLAQNEIASIWSVLHIIDLDCCQIAFDGKNVICSNAFIQSVQTNTMINYKLINPNYKNLQLQQKGVKPKIRINKYIKRGFNLIVTHNFNDHILFIHELEKHDKEKKKNINKNMNFEYGYIPLFGSIPSTFFKPITKVATNEFMMKTKVNRIMSLLSNTYQFKLNNDSFGIRSLFINLFKKQLFIKNEDYDYEPTAINLYDQKFDCDYHGMLNVISHKFECRQVLFVSNLDLSVNEEILFSIFNEIGPIQYIYLYRNDICSNHIGFGYIRYKYCKDIEHAIKQFDGYTIGRNQCFLQKDTMKLNRSLC